MLPPQLSALALTCENDVGAFLAVRTASKHLRTFTRDPGSNRLWMVSILHSKYAVDVEYIEGCKTYM